MRKIKYNPKILILTLNSGENEYEDSLVILRKQSYKNWEHVVFSNLPNKIAHEKLYSYIMDHSNDYDLFVKLDADMMLWDENSLENIVRYFEKNPNVDQANFSVWDVISNQKIIGLIVFTRNARWEKTNEMLFVDHTPKIPGKRLLIWGNPSPVAYHCHNPHPSQAFHFGAHRAMKAIQKDREKKNTIQSVIQWNFLWRAWRFYKRDRNAPRAYFILGAYHVWNGDLGYTSNNYSDSTLKEVFEKCQNLSEEEIYTIIKDKFSRKLWQQNLMFILFWAKLYEYRLRFRLKVFYNRLHMVLLNRK